MTRFLRGFFSKLFRKNVGVEISKPECSLSDSKSDSREDVEITLPTTTIDDFKLSNQIPPKTVRINEVFRRLKGLPNPSDRDGAHQLIKSTLNDVEDEYTDFPMYHQDRMNFFDFTVDGWKDLDGDPARLDLNSHIAHLYNNGHIKIVSNKSGSIVFNKGKAPE